VNSAPWMEAYMTMNITMRLPQASPRRSFPASHQYHSGKADEIRVIIWTW